MTMLGMIFLILALLCFIADAAGIAAGRLNLQSAGLAFLVAAMLSGVG